MEELIRLLSIMAAMGTFVLSLIAAAWYVLQPLEDRAKATDKKLERPRFQLIDLVCLLVYLQVIAGAISGQIRSLSSPLIIVAFVEAICGFVVWFVCVRALNRVAIESSARRATFMLVCVPGTIAATFAFGLCSAAILLRVVQRTIQSGGEWLDLIPISVFMTLCAAIFLLRLVFQWIAADGHSAAKVRPPLSP